VWDYDPDNIRQNTYEYEFRAVFTEDAGYTVTVLVATSSPALGGTVSGGGSFASGSSCTVTATPNQGYSFEKWTATDSAQDTALSLSASYTFTVTGNVTLYAHFNRATTNLLLHGSSNTLLHGSSGTLLHDA
jgi:uncharacterized repeat protein (TIGR02543 family)